MRRAKGCRRFEITVYLTRAIRRNTKHGHKRIYVFSVGNVEVIFENSFTLSMPRPSSSLIHARRLESKLRVWFAVTHYFESEIHTSWLRTSKYIV